MTDSVKDVLDIHRKTLELDKAVSILTQL